MTGKKMEEKTLRELVQSIVRVLTGTNPRRRIGHIFGKKRKKNMDSKWM
jgi:hypothetical protein